MLYGYNIYWTCKYKCKHLRTICDELMKSKPEFGIQRKNNWTLYAYLYTQILRAWPTSDHSKGFKILIEIISIAEKFPHSDKKLTIEVKLEGSHHLMHEREHILRVKRNLFAPLKMGSLFSIVAFKFIHEKKSLYTISTNLSMVDMDLSVSVVWARACIWSIKKRKREEGGGGSVFLCMRLVDQNGGKICAHLCGKTNKLTFW